MTKLLNILFITFCIWGWAQNYSPVVELQFPKQIPLNSTFDISLVSDNSVIEADALNLYMISDNKLDVNSAEVITENDVLPVTILHSALTGEIQNVHLAKIQFKSNELLHNSFFQLIINFSHFGPDDFKVKFFGEFVRENKVVYSIGNSDKTSNQKKNDLLAEIKTYKPEKFISNAAKFDTGSNLKINLNEITADKLWIGFWIKFNGSCPDFIELIDKKNDDPFLKISLSQSQKLILTNQNEEILNSDAPFLSKKIWNHLGIEMNTIDRIISFYSSGIIFAKQSFNNLPVFKDLIFALKNNSLQPFTIEQLRIAKLKNGTAKILEDSKYNSISSKNIEPILQLNFDNLNELSYSTNKADIVYNDLKFVPSNAPIFSRAPELNVSFTSTYIQLEWIVRDASNALNFVVEKSVEENKFIPVGNVAVDENTISYNYIDAFDNKNEIVFYRIKQINKDGSIIYSSQVKLGLGSIEQFKLNQNYPNPFNPLTSIEIDLFEDSEIEIIIYNIEGQEIVVLHKGLLSKGIHKFDFDAKDLPSGVYLCKVSSPQYSQTKKMLLTK